MPLALQPLKLPTLVLYAYTPGSYFDSILTTYMIKPGGIDPAIIQYYHQGQNNGSATASVSVALETASWNHDPIATS